MKKQQREEIRKVIDYYKEMLELTLYDLELDEEGNTSLSFEQATKEMKKLNNDFANLLAATSKIFKN
jgi:hypothetical protein